MFIADLKHAVRSLVRARGFTGIAVATLGAALGLAVTVTAVVNAYLLRLLPYPASDRLYNVQYGPQGQLPPRELEKLDWASLNDVVEHAIAWDLDLINVRGAPYPEAL